jgi:cytochrome c oxidase subunit II
VRGAHRKAPGGRSRAPVVEVVYAGALALVSAFLLWVTFTAETPIDRTAAHPGFQIRVIAAQWSWRFIYPGGVSVADVDTWHPTRAYVPTGTLVEFVGSSEDVIHGFWVPELHYQRQLVPGYATRFDLVFQKPGYYGGECSVLCGEDHGEMHFALEAVSPQSFRGWLAREAARQGVAS